MLNRLLTRVADYLRRNALAAVALFVALGGTGYATTALPSHTSAQSAAKHRATPLKAGGQVVAWAIVNSKGHVVAGNPRPRVRALLLGGSSKYQVSWRGVPTSHRRTEYCASSVTIDDQFGTPDETIHGQPIGVGYADATNRGHVVYVDTFAPSGQPAPLGFEVVLICSGS